MPNNTCPPLLAVQNIGRKYPGIWDLMDHFANASDHKHPPLEIKMKLLNKAICVLNVSILVDNIKNIEYLI